MRALWITRYGKPEVLEVREGPDPEPRAGEVRVRVRACGLNFTEVMARQGLYPDAPKPPMVMGYEGSGVIDAVGAEVDPNALGKRVVFVSRFGAHADAVCVPAPQALPIPDSMSFDMAAAIPVNYLTAYMLLFDIARLRPGARVLVHMAAGGVGTAALQLCRTVADVTTFGTASERKHPFAQSNGCDHPIDYRNRDYVNEVRRLTGNEGIDLVLDPLGGDDWKKGYELLKPTGMLIAFGFANMNRGGKRRVFHVLNQLLQVPKFSPMQLMNDNRAVAGLNMGHLWGEMVRMRGIVEKLLNLWEDGQIRPHIDRVFPFSEGPEAHRYLEGGESVGKVILRPELDP